MTTKLLIVVNEPSFFLSHRLPIAEGAKKMGYEVHIATRDGESVSLIKELGFFHHILPLSRSGRNPFIELWTLISIWWLFLRVRPTLVHLVTIKPLLYGGLAARLAGVPCMVAAVSGLGFVFSDPTRQRGVVGWAVSFLYRCALGKKNLKVIFQNRDDRDAVMSMSGIDVSSTALIRGSGVDLVEYDYHPEREGVPVVLFAARLLRDKGVTEFVKAAEILKKREVLAQFLVVGDPDFGNLTSVTQQELDRWAAEGYVTSLGFRRDINKLFMEAHVVVLPSYYGEGLPKVLVEAAACGRAVVTTDHPGCRDAIDPDITGLLVPIKDPIALADAIEKLIKDPELRKRMGRAGRELAEREFGIEKIVQQHLDIYRELEARA